MALKYTRNLELEEPPFSKFFFWRTPPILESSKQQILDESCRWRWIARHADTVQYTADVVVGCLHWPEDARVTGQVPACDA